MEGEETTARGANCSGGGNSRPSLSSASIVLVTSRWGTDIVTSRLGGVASWSTRLSTRADGRGLPGPVDPQSHVGTTPAPPGGRPGPGWGPGRGAGRAMGARTVAVGAHRGPEDGTRWGPSRGELTVRGRPGPRQDRGGGRHRVRRGHGGRGAAPVRGEASELSGGEGLRVGV